MSNIDEILGKLQEHESYGIIGFHRTTSNMETPLFGSSIKHRDTIRLTLKTGQMRRNLNEDWYYGNKTLFEVEMSASQFADLITSLNVGDGVPCTIKVIQTGPLHRCEEPPFIDRNELHVKEFKEHTKDLYETSNNLIQCVEDKFANKKTLNKADKKEILDMLRRLRNNIGCNQEFQLEQFDRHMERTTTEAKGEIEAFFQNKINQIANKAISENSEKLTEGIKSPVSLGVKRGSDE